MQFYILSKIYIFLFLILISLLHKIKNINKKREKIKKIKKMGLIINTIIFIIFALIGFLLYDAGLVKKIKVFRDKVPKMTIAGIRYKGI